VLSHGLNKIEVHAPGGASDAIVWRAN